MDWDDPKFKQEIQKRISLMTLEEKQVLARIIIEHVNQIAKPIMNVIENTHTAKLLMNDIEPNSVAVDKTQELLDRLKI